jgi:hypothetical protein
MSCRENIWPFLCPVAIGEEKGADRLPCAARALPGEIRCGSLLSALSMRASVTSRVRGKYGLMQKSTLNLAYMSRCLDQIS